MQSLFNGLYQYFAMGFRYTTTSLLAILLIVLIVKVPMVQAAAKVPPLEATCVNATLDDLPSPPDDLAANCVCDALNGPDNPQYFASSTFPTVGGGNTGGSC